MYKYKSFPFQKIILKQRFKQKTSDKFLKMSNKQNLLLLFERPQEPVFIEKGPNKAVFDVPSEFIPERYRDIGMDISSHFSEMANEKIPVRSDVELPDLELPLSLGRHEQFSLFIPRHRKLAGKLIDSFMSELIVRILFENRVLKKLIFIFRVEDI